MRALPLALFVWFALGPVHAQESKPGKGLDPISARVVDKAVPAVASIFVTRTELYERLGQVAADVALGKLGRFAAADLGPLGDLTRSQRDTLLDRLDLSRPGHVPQTFGSGVVLEPQGLVLTNYHVVRDATKLFVRLPDGTGSYADIHAADVRSDLAVLRLLDVKGPLPTLPLGDASGLKRGGALIALAQAQALGSHAAKPVAVAGNIASFRRRMVTFVKDEDVKLLHQYGSLLQIDARQNLGASGGAILDGDGRMVGLISAWPGLTAAPGGLAVPMDRRFRAIVETLLRGEEVEYGFLGVGLPDRAWEAKHGVTVKQVYAGSPAARAGLGDEDRIVAVDGEKIENSEDLFLLVGGHQVGAKVKLEYRRFGAGLHTTEVTLGKLWSPGQNIWSSTGKRPFVRGLRVDDPCILVQQFARWSVIPGGVVITDVTRDSVGDKAMLKVGDVVTHVAGMGVRTPAEFYAAMAKHKDAVELTIWDDAAGGPGPKVTVK